MKTTIRLTIGNSYSKIEGLTVKGFNELKKNLSYDIGSSAAYFSGSSHNTRRSLLGARGDFPTGLLPIAYEVISDQCLGDLQVIDNRTPPTTRLNDLQCVLPHSPYPEQQEAALEGVYHERGCVVMPTGSGKSVTMALLIGELKLKTLVVTPNLTLKQQLTESFTKYFGNLDHITVENINSPKLKTLTGYDVLIIDEAHHTAAATYRALNKKQWAGIYHRYFFTATPFRSRSEEQLLYESVAGQVIYNLTYQKAIKSNYIVPVEAYYVEVPKSNTDGYTWGEVYKDLVVKNQVRNELISELLFRLHTAKVPALCLVKEISHGQRLNDMTGVAFAHGINDETPQLIEWFNAGQIGTLVGTTGVLGEGVDTKPAEYVIIAGLGKSRPAFMQQVGRGMRKYPGKDSCKVIIFKDASHKWTKAHFREQCKILKEEYNVIPIKIDVDVSGQS